jgi:S1-C subfamily serine protease
MSNPHKDLVYIKIKYPSGAHPTTALLKYTDNKSTLSGDVFSIGYPILNLRQKKSWNVSIPKNYRKTIKRFSRGKLLGKGHSRNQVYILAHNADMLAGNSGGPLVDVEGKIIGVNAGVFDFNGKNKAKSSKYDYSPGAPDRFYFAVSTSEVLKDVEHIKENELWQGSERWLVEIAQLKDRHLIRHYKK